MSKMAAGAHGSRQQLYGVEDDVDAAFSVEELARRPEVRFINRYAVFRAYVLMALKGIGALVLLWATVVLLGGFVSSLKKKDFWYISFIAFVEAGGMFNAIGDKQLKHLVAWMISAMTKINLRHSAMTKINAIGDKQLKHSYVGAPPHACSMLKRGVRSIISKSVALIVFVILYLVLSFCLFGPIICAGLSYWRLRQTDYASADKDASQGNLKPGMDLFYYLCVAQGVIFVCIVFPVELLGTTLLVKMVSRQVGLSREVVRNYCITTNLKYLNNLASSDESWNLITYSAGLLDSEMPEENASGARVLAMLIDQGVPVRRLLVRSPRHRIQKLIGALVWRSPAEGEMRWLATRIVEDIAHDLNLAQFPGALECISSLLNTSSGSGYNKDDDQEAIHFIAKQRLDEQQRKQKSSVLVKLKKLIQRIYRSSEKEQASINSAEGTNEDLILQGLRILENLALDEHNCNVICSNDALFSKIIAPVSSKNLIEDMKENTPWTKVTDGSLKLVSRLMKCPGMTGKDMRLKVETNSSAVENLEEILKQEINSSNMVALQIRAIEILEQLYSGEYASTSWARERGENLKKLIEIYGSSEKEQVSINSAEGTNEDLILQGLIRKRRENLIIKVRHIFLSDKWMEDYLSKRRKMLEEDFESQLCKSKKSKKSQQARPELVENKMKEAQETVSQLKEKVGETLATLCMGNQIDSKNIMSFTECGEVVHYLTEMLDSEERTIRCRFSAAVILKHLCTHCTLDQGYVKETTLKKVLRGLLHIKTEAQGTSTTRKSIHWWHGISQGGNDIENQSGGGHDERLPVQIYKLQHEERMLQVALLSLCTAIRGRWINAPDFASVVAQLVSPEDLVGKLKKIVAENRYPTMSCLATVKLTCEFVTALIPHDHDVEEVKMKKEIVDSLWQASKMMAGLESCLLFAGSDRDCYGLPLKPFCSDLVKQARELLRQKEQEIGLNIV